MYICRFLEWPLTKACVVICLVTVFSGCVDCNSHVCRVTSKVAYDIYWVRTLCCEEPDNELCREMLPRIPGLTALVVDAKVACDQHNWDRMKQIWNDIRELGLPLPYVRGLWSVICNEDLEVACNSHPFFGPEDSFDFKGTFQRMELPVRTPTYGDVSIRHIDSSSVFLPNTGGNRKEERYELSSGSLSASTWLGNDEFEIQGELRIKRSDHEMSSRFDPEFCKAFQPTQAVFNMSGELVQGRLVLDPTYFANVLRVDTSGKGLLCGKFHIQLSLRDDPLMTLDGILHEAWIELPVRVDDTSIHIESFESINALTLFPVDPKISSILKNGLTNERDSNAFDLGCSEMGRDAMEVFMDLFPECFDQLRVRRER